jgi:transposase
VPAVPSCILEPQWNQLQALVPARSVRHPLGCHRLRVPDSVIFDKLIQVSVFGCGYHRIAHASCSATTLRRRRDQWIALGLAEQLHQLALAAYDRLYGSEPGPAGGDPGLRGGNPDSGAGGPAGGCYPIRPRCTWTAATTTSPAGKRWPTVGCGVRSPRVGRQRRFRRATPR